MASCLIAMTLCVALSSCEKEIEFNGEQSDPKLVINSLVEPGQPVKAAITKSYFFLDTPNTTAPADVVASLYVNGNLVGALTQGTDTIWDYYGMPDHRLVTRYFSDYVPEEGDVVKISATASGYDEVEGSTSPLPQITDCQLEVEVSEWTGEYIREYDYETEEYGDTMCYHVEGYFNLTFTITDPNPGKTDCFRFIEGTNNVIRDGLNTCYVNFGYDDPIFEASITENDLLDFSSLDTRPEGVFTDMMFDGGSYHLKVTARFYCDVYDQYEFNPDYFRGVFVMEHLSKEYYQYLNTCDQGDLTQQIFSEPIQTFYNVENGYGIVCGRAENKFFVPIPLEDPR
jgi:hypothetical protein